MLFWDMVVLNGYLFLNIIVGWVSLQYFKNDMTPPKWVKILAMVSVIWAFSIHTVTAFLYAGLPGRHYFLTAIMAARFLASAFCSGPAILLLLTLLLRRMTGFDPGKKAINTLAVIITYAMCVNIFFFLLEMFTAFYSNMPGHMAPIIFLFNGLDGNTTMVPFMWTAVVLGLGCLVFLIPTSVREKTPALVTGLIMLVIASWIDKGLGLLIGGFTPNPFETVTAYFPTVPEIMVSLMVFSMGGIVLTVLWKIAIEVRREVEGGNISLVPPGRIAWPHADAKGPTPPGAGPFFMGGRCVWGGRDAGGIPPSFPALAPATRPPPGPVPCLRRGRCGVRPGGWGGPGQARPWDWARRPRGSRPRDGGRP